MHSNEMGHVKRTRDDFSEDVVSKNLKRIRISEREDGENDDDFYDEEEPINHTETMPRRSTLDPLYFSPGQKGRHIDILEDDLIRKSRRRSMEQTSVASSIPASNFAVILPPAIGPHPATDVRYLSRQAMDHAFRHSHTERRQSDTPDTVTHQEWFALSGYGNNSMPSYEESYDSDDCEDMVVTG